MEGHYNVRQLATPGLYIFHNWNICRCPPFMEMRLEQPGPQK